MYALILMGTPLTELEFYPRLTMDQVMGHIKTSYDNEQLIRTLFRYTSPGHIYKTDDYFIVDQGSGNPTFVTTPNGGLIAW